MAYNNPVDTRTEAVRNEAQQRLMEVMRKSNPNFPASEAETIEKRIFERTKNREEYVNLFKRIIQRAQLSAQQKAAAQQQQQQQLQQQLHQQQMQQQQQSQLQQQQQQQSQMNQMFSGPSSNTAVQQQASAGSMFSKVQSSVVQVQQNTNAMLPQNSQGQAIQIRQPVHQIAHNNSSISRAMPGTAPSPQSTVIGSYQPRPQWSQPSPGNQFSSSGHFAQPRPPVQTNTQPVLTMPDSTGTPHPSAIPSLSPAHPSPQIGTTSPSLRTPGSVQAAPSPGQLTLATVPSPASVGQMHADDDKEYMEKLKQLQKYIEPLSRMINKFNEGEEQFNKDLSKMKNLRDTLINPSKRLHISTLEKCEKVLQSWLDQKPAQPPFPQQQPNQHMCQPILNIIATASKSPLLNHTLKRTFGPAMRTICGDYSPPDYLPSKRQCIRKSIKQLEKRKANQVMPSIMQNEIARLNSKFNIKLDKSQSDNGSVRILCFLDDPRLPSVPPLQLSVPKSYPEDCPKWIRTPVFVPDYIDSQDMSADEGEKEQKFEKILEPILDERMANMNQSSCTISSLVNAWEVSVRQACSAIA